MRAAYLHRIHGTHAYAHVCRRICRYLIYVLSHTQYKASPKRQCDKLLHASPILIYMRAACFSSLLPTFYLLLFALAMYTLYNTAFVSSRQEQTWLEGGSQNLSSCLDCLQILCSAVSYYVCVQRGNYCESDRRQELTNYNYTYLGSIDAWQPLVFLWLLTPGYILYALTRRRLQFQLGGITRMGNPLQSRNPCVYTTYTHILVHADGEKVVLLQMVGTNYYIDTTYQCTNAYTTAITLQLLLCVCCMTCLSLVPLQVYMHTLLDTTYQYMPPLSDLHSRIRIQYSSVKLPARISLKFGQNRSQVFGEVITLSSIYTLTVHP